VQTPPPLPPTVEADRANATIGGTISADAAHGVLANDTDPIPNETLIVSAVDGQAANVGHAVAGAYGTLTLNADGSYSYAANSSHALPASGVGEDIFTYTAKDGAGGVADTTLTVVVTAAGLTYVAVPAGGSATQANGGHSAVLDGGAGNATLTAANGVAAVLIGGPHFAGHGHGAA
jgi:VCBS repeat-containing protein